MLNHFFAWTRRNTRKAVALLLGPGFLFLALDAGIAHFVGKEPTSAGLQRIPVYYGMAAALLLAIAVIPRSRAVFAVIVRGLGVIGIGVGLTGTWFHLKSLLADMNGSYDWPSIQGALGGSPVPVFAPLAFTGIGALVFMLASPKLLLRYKIGRTDKKGGEVVSLAEGERTRNVG